MKPQISAMQHYDRLAEMGHWHNDSPAMLRYMARWDGPLFFELLGNTTEKDLLEIGIGNGRIARQVLMLGCRTLTGLDISSKTIAATKSDMVEFSNLELVVSDIGLFHQQKCFDIAYSVLTFMHIKDKMGALWNIVNAVRPGGYLVLSIDHASEWLDFGEWCVPLYPWSPEQYAQALENSGCCIDSTAPIIDRWIGSEGTKSDTYGTEIATLIKAVKL